MNPLIARLFAYVPGILFIGSGLILLAHGFSAYLDSFGWRSGLAWFFVFAMWSNSALLIIRRFSSKIRASLWFHILLGSLLVLPTVVLIFLQPETVLPFVQIPFLLLITTSTILGASLGQALGEKKRVELLHRHSQKNIDPSLKRVHEKLPKN